MGRIAPAVADESIALEARRVSKHFPGVRALDEVDLQLRPGRLVALLGENGAGKSTLMNICAGVYPPDDGQLLVAGREVRFRSPRDANLDGISAIFQELSLAPNLSVAENIFLGREPRTRFGLIDYRTMNRDAEAVLVRMNVAIPPHIRVARLRLGDQQAVEIARALSTRARVLIMDEPTSALSHQEINSLLELIADLKLHGLAIIYITHKFEELADVGDDVVIMRDGRSVAAAEYRALSNSDIVRLMVGRERTKSCVSAVPRIAGTEVLRAENISLPPTSPDGDFRLRNVALHACRGEVVGLFGLMGAGRTELLETIFGAHAELSEGTVSVGGVVVRNASPTHAIAAGMALIPEDRKHDGLILNMSARENASLASLRFSKSWGFLSARRETAHVRPLLERIGLRAVNLDEPVRNLSGGNQQKIVLAKWPAIKPKVLLLDEPTRGIDVNAKAEIYALIDELAKSGMAVILASSEMPEILALADRIIVMREGRIAAEFSRGNANAESIMNAALPLKAAAVPT